MSNHLIRLTVFGSALLAPLTFLPQTTRAEIFLLKNGGRIEGEWLNPKELPRETYKIRTAKGVEIALPRDQVKDTVTVLTNRTFISGNLTDSIIPIFVLGVVLIALSRLRHPI